LSLFLHRVWLYSWTVHVFCCLLFDKPHSYNLIWFIIFLVFFLLILLICLSFSIIQCFFPITHTFKMTVCFLFWIKKNTTEERFSFYCRKFEILHSSWIFLFSACCSIVKWPDATHLMSFLGCAAAAGSPHILLLFWFGKKGRGKQSKLWPLPTSWRNEIKHRSLIYSFALLHFLTLKD